jgi:nucleosome assembly protein 1-like 1
MLKKKVKTGAKNTKPVTKIEPCDSFFTFFNPPEVPEEDEEIDQDKVLEFYWHEKYFCFALS